MRHLNRHLTYCLNVHPGETYADGLAAVRRYPPDIRARLGCAQPFGLGLRLGIGALDEAETPAGIDALRELLAAESLYVFTLNGFPYGRFHDTAVKTSVYEPDWRSPLRRDYTVRLARWLALLLPDGVEGSISTVPVAYRAALGDGEGLEGIARHLADCARALREIEDRTGKLIHVGLEPEPDCWVDTTEGAIVFFEETLLRHGVAAIRAADGASAGQAEALLRRHIGYCLDTCHFAVQFESPTAALRRWRAAGLRLSKVQLSAALTLAPGVDPERALTPFADAVYLHQVRAGRDGKVRHAYPDLPAALGAAGRRAPDEEWRIHCHVPLHWAGEPGGCGTTRGDLDDGFWRALREAEVSHGEIETYTYSVLPEAVRTLPLAESLAAEYRWVLEASDYFRVPRK